MTIHPSCDSAANDHNADRTAALSDVPLNDGRLDSRVPFMLALIAAIVVAYERLQGRVWWCACRRFTPISLHVNSMHNSQHLFDAYSFSHVLHGLLLFGLLWLIARRLAFGWRLVAATAIEAGWEMVENSAFIIHRYRANTASFGYSGDSVFNSLGDMASCVAGFYLARRLGWKASAAVFVAVELIMLWTIRDNLTLNVLMLLRPITAIRNWQAAG